MGNVKNRGLFHLLGEFKVPSLLGVRRTIKFYLSRAGCPSMQVTMHPVILLKERSFVVALGNPYKTSGKLPGRI